MTIIVNSVNMPLKGVISKKVEISFGKYVNLIFLPFHIVIITSNIVVRTSVNCYDQVILFSQKLKKKIEIS